VDKPTPIYTPLFSPTGQLLKGATSVLFNFSSAPFLHPDTGITTVVARLLELSTTRRVATVSQKINMLLVSYFQARDAIKEAFFDNEH
jgi:hypothetical protein